MAQQLWSELQLSPEQLAQLSDVFYKRHKAAIGVRALFDSIGVQLVPQYSSGADLLDDGRRVSRSL